LPGRIISCGRASGSRQAAANCTRYVSALLAFGSDEDGGHLRRIDRRIEELRAGQLGEMDKFIADLLYFPPIFSPDFMRSDDLPDVCVAECCGNFKPRIFE
jgi:hypothetical protein